MIVIGKDPSHAWRASAASVALLFAVAAVKTSSAAAHEGPVQLSRAELQADSSGPDEEAPDARQWLVAALAASGLVAISVALIKSIFPGIKALFQPQEPVPISNPLVHLPVKITAQRMGVQELKRSMPTLAPFAEDLPIGMGIKGGIARKMVKMQEGNPEPPGSFDIDVIVFTDVDEVDPEYGTVLRSEVTGRVVGDLRIEAQDVEVMPKSSLQEYFVTRDITQNEVVLIKTAPGQVLLLASEDCRRDCRLGRSTPAVHGLSCGLTISWDVQSDGRCFTSEHLMSRTIVRFLKGHATEYGVDDATWAHYRSVGLSIITLFKILKHFHDDDAKYQCAIDHLIGLGVLSRATIRAAGGSNGLWGHLLMEINKACSRFGGRLTLTDLDPEAVERWIAQKKAKLGDKLVNNTWRAKRIGYIPMDEDVLTLGITDFPQEMLDFESEGPAFGTAAPKRPSQKGSGLQLPGFGFASTSLSASGVQVPKSKKAAGKSPMSRSPAATSFLEEAAVPLLSGEGESNHTDLSLSKRAIMGKAHSGIEASALVERSGSSLASLSGDLHGDRLEVSFFELANPDREEDEHQQLPGRSGLNPSKITRRELFDFIVAVIWPHKWLLLVAHVLLLVGVLFRVLTSKFEGDALSAMSQGGKDEFSAAFRVVVLVWGASLVTEVAGNVAMQVFARQAMTGLFTRLFSHLVNQDVELFATLTVGEVSARCSGDSLTLKGIITYTTFSIISGCVQALFALGLLLVSAIEAFKYSPILTLAAPLALTAEVAYSMVFGFTVAHPLNHQARRSLGRMYGFLYDTFSQIPTVQSLGLVASQSYDYGRFVEHYWSNRLKLDLWLVLEAGFSSLVGIVLTLTFLDTLGKGFFAEAIVSIGAVYSVLRYVQSMQRGVKTASDGFARIAASMGSVERLVELHNTGRLHGGAPRLSSGGGGPSSAAAAAAPSPGPAVEPMWIGSLAGGLRLVNVSCSYPYKSNDVVLRDVNLEVPAGAVVCLNGSSGSGKSSILRAAYLRLQPFKGQIQFEVLRPLAPAAAALRPTEWKTFNPLEHSVTDIRGQVAVCSLETLGTFFASVETNVACAAGNLQVTSADVRKACEVVGLDKLVYSKLNDGYFSPIGGPSGVALNNDLLVRISLARAIVRKPRICLLDETDHFCYVVGIPVIKKFLLHLTNDGCSVLLSTWNMELAKELSKAPPSKPRTKLVYSIKDGCIV